MPDYAHAAEERLISEVERGDIRGVKSALAAGVSVDGSGKLAGTPLVVAVSYGHFSITKLLIEKGADLEICLQRNSHCCAIMEGMRAIHVATMRVQLDILRLLIQASANPNCADVKGSTPLMAACRDNSTQGVLMAQELLKGGADPFQPDNGGLVALHYAAGEGRVDVMDTLLTQAPTTLNHISLGGMTPLGLAAFNGKDRAVSYLLSVGASNRAAINAAVERGAKGSGGCPLTPAVIQGHENVVRILLDDGFEAIGGLSFIPLAITFALVNQRRRILQRLLNVEGEGRQGYWAKCCHDKNPMASVAAAFVDPAGMSVLLAAGADETALCFRGRRARDIIGEGLSDGERDAVKVAAVFRTLERGPAFRAQSWRWPSRRDTGATTRTAAADDVAALSSRHEPH